MSNIIQFDLSVIYFNKMRIVNYCIYIVTFVNIPKLNRTGLSVLSAILNTGLYLHIILYI
jgi:hypothetical protein